MKWRTHLSFGLFLYLFFINFFEIQFRIISLLITLLFSVLPDIDMFKSKISKKTRPFSLIFNIFKHRGWFHSVYLFLLLTILFRNEYIMIGYLSHVLLDMFSKGGVKIFYPLKFRLKLIDLQILEPIFFLILIIASIFLLI